MAPHAPISTPIGRRWIKHPVLIGSLLHLSPRVRVRNLRQLRVPSWKRLRLRELFPARTPLAAGSVYSFSFCCSSRWQASPWRHGGSASDPNHTAIRWLDKGFIDTSDPRHAGLLSVRAIPNRPSSRKPPSEWVCHESEWVCHETGVTSIPAPQPKPINPIDFVRRIFPGRSRGVGKQGS